MKKNILIAIMLFIILGGIGIYVYGIKSNTNSHTMMNHGQTQQPVAQSHRSYTLDLLSETNTIQPNQQTQIRYKITDDTGTTVKDFALDHTKLMHFIVVRDDLQDFQHVHPDFDKTTGEFSISFSFPENGKYRLFADFTPAGGQKDSEGNLLAVTPYKDIVVGNVSNYTPKSISVDTNPIKTVGNFTITYSLPQPIEKGKPTTITLHVAKNGQPVTDMEEYLGAQAHGILLMKDSLNFAHLHAMGTEEQSHGGSQMMGEHMMNGSNTQTMSISKGPDITFTYTFPSSGIYKLFTQFQEQGKVITTDYTMNVE